MAVADADAAAEALVDGEGDAAGCEADALPVVVPLVPCSFIGAASSLSAGGCEP